MLSIVVSTTISASYSGLRASPQNHTYKPSSSSSLTCLSSDYLGEALKCNAPKSEEIHVSSHPLIVHFIEMLKRDLHSVILLSIKIRQGGFMETGM